MFAAERNDLEGSLPAAIRSWSGAMKSFEASINWIEGALPEGICSLSLMKVFKG